jgi:hypothetical protein
VTPIKKCGHERAALHRSGCAAFDAGADGSEIAAIMMLQLLKTSWPVLIGALLGSAIGYYGQCTSGTCVFSSTWWGGAIAGVLVAALAAESFRSSS